MRESSGCLEAARSSIGWLRSVATMCARAGSLAASARVSTPVPAVISGILGRLLPPYRDAGIVQAAASNRWPHCFATSLHVGEPFACLADRLRQYSVHVHWRPPRRFRLRSWRRLHQRPWVCGLSRLSPRSLVATATFMTTGFATVFVVRHVIGAGLWASSSMQLRELSSGWAW